MQTSFIVDLESGVARYRVRIVTEKGKVLDFVVQLEFLGGGEWRPVVRYDTAHGFAHRDSYDPSGKVVPHQPLEVSNYNQALTFALDEAKGRWQKLIGPFREANP